MDFGKIGKDSIRKTTSDYVPDCKPVEGSAKRKHPTFEKLENIALKARDGSDEVFAYVAKVAEEKFQKMQEDGLNYSMRYDVQPISKAFTTKEGVSYKQGENQFYLRVNFPMGKDNPITLLCYFEKGEDGKLNLANYMSAQRWVNGKVEKVSYAELPEQAKDIIRSITGYEGKGIIYDNDTPKGKIVADSVSFELIKQSPLGIITKPDGSQEDGRKMFYVKSDEKTGRPKVEEVTITNPETENDEVFYRVVVNPKQGNSLGYTNSYGIYISQDSSQCAISVISFNQQPDGKFKMEEEFHNIDDDALWEIIGDDVAGYLGNVLNTAQETARGYAEKAVTADSKKKPTPSGRGE